VMILDPNHHSYTLEALLSSTLNNVCGASKQPVFIYVPHQNVDKIKNNKFNFDFYNIYWHELLAAFD